MIVERRTDRAFQLVAFMRLVILSKVLLAPCLPPFLVQFENLQFPTSTRVCAPERSLMPLSLHTCTNLWLVRRVCIPFILETGIRRREIREKLANVKETKKEEIETLL